MTSATPTETAPGRLPDDPEAFVTAAERAVNERDLEAWVRVYAPGAVLRSVTDGARGEHYGADAIRQAVAGYLAGMEATGFELRKELLDAAEGLVVNRWESRFRAGRRGEGIETWRFGADGQVVEHTMLTFFDVRSSTSAIARLRLMAAYPRIALAFLRATRGRR